MDIPAPRHTRLESIAQYIEGVDAVIAKAQRRVRVFDRSLEGTGFNSPGRHELLRAFLRARRTNHLYIVVHDPGYLSSRCARMQLLLRQFSDGITIHQTHPHVEGVHDPFVIADEAHFVRRFHFDDSRSLLALDDPQEARALNERFDQLWEASFPAIFATTLGL